jgi:hypothetical protein
MIRDALGDVAAATLSVREKEPRTKVARGFSLP